MKTPVQLEPLPTFFLPSLALPTPVPGERPVLRAFLLRISLSESRSTIPSWRLNFLLIMCSPLKRSKLRRLPSFPLRQWSKQVSLFAITAAATPIAQSGIRMFEHWRRTLCCSTTFHSSGHTPSIKLVAHLLALCLPATSPDTLILSVFVFASAPFAFSALPTRTSAHRTLRVTRTRSLYTHLTFFGVFAHLLPSMALECHSPAD